MRNLRNNIGFSDANNISNIIYKIKEQDKLKKNNIKLNEKGEENKKDNTLKNKNSKLSLNIKGISQRHILGHPFRGKNYLNKIYINGYSQEI